MRSEPSLKNLLTQKKRGSILRNSGASQLLKVRPVVENRELLLAESDSAPNATTTATAGSSSEILSDMLSSRGAMALSRLGTRLQ